MTLDELEGLREGWEFEAKAALKGCLPKSFWETYSAMANTTGGRIALGIVGNKSGSLKLQGIEDVLKDLWSTLENRSAVSVNLLGRGDPFVSATRKGPRLHDKDRSFAIKDASLHDKDLSSAIKPTNSAIKDESSAIKPTNSAIKNERPAIGDIVQQVAASKRSRRSLVREAILALCSNDFLRAEAIATRLNRNAQGLRNDYIIPMLNEGLLVARFPDTPNHPQQAYKRAKEGNA